MKWRGGDVSYFFDRMQDQSTINIYISIYILNTKMSYFNETATKQQQQQNNLQPNILIPSNNVT